MKTETKWSSPDRTAEKNLQSVVKTKGMPFKQALQSSSELLQQNMELHRTACKLIELNACSLNCMQAHRTVCKLMNCM